MIDAADERELVLWGARCAEHVLDLFERERPEDSRPRLAIAAARAWAEDGLSRREARAAALSAWAAVCDCQDVQAMSAARAAGHMAAASGSWSYVRPGAFFAAVSADDPIAERAWQRQQLSERLRPAVGLKAWAPSKVERLLAQVAV